MPGEWAQGRGDELSRSVSDAPAQMTDARLMNFFYCVQGLDARVLAISFHPCVSYITTDH